MPIVCATQPNIGLTAPATGIYGTGDYATQIVQPHQHHGSSITQILLGILILLVVILIQALLVMILWNWVVPKIWIGAPQISYGTAFGLVLLIDVFGAIISGASFWKPKVY